MASQVSNDPSYKRVKINIKNVKFICADVVSIDIFCAIEQPCLTYINISILVISPCLDLSNLGNLKHKYIFLL